MSAVEAGRLQDGSIDAGLFLLSAITPRGVELTQREIAFVCGCSPGYIYWLEKSAIKKIGLALKQKPHVRELLTTL